MSDTKSGDDKTLSVNQKKTLSLKRGGNEPGTVRQNFSHGRTKNVVVETKKRRVTRPEAGETAAPSVAAGLKPRAPEVATPAPTIAQAPQKPVETLAPTTAPGGVTPPAARPQAPSGKPRNIEFAKPQAPKAEPVAETPQSAADEAPKAVADAKPAEAPSPEASAPVEAVAAPKVEPSASEAKADVATPAPSAEAKTAAPATPAAPGRAPAQPAGRTQAPSARPGQNAPRGRDDRRPDSQQNRGPNRPGGRDDRRPSNTGAAPGQRPRGAVLSDLSSREMDARRRALELAKQREVEARRVFQEDEARRKSEDERRQRERAEAEQRAAEAAERQAREAEESRKAEEDAKRKPVAAKPRAGAAPAQPDPMSPADAEAALARGTRPDARRKGVDDEDARGGVRSRKSGAKAPAEAPRAAKTPADRRRGKLTLDKALSGDDGGRGRSLSSIRRRQEKFKRSQQSVPREKISRVVVIPETITIQELANRMSERAVDVIKYLMKEGQMMKPGDIIDQDLAEIIAGEFGHTVERVAESDVEEGIFNVEDKSENLQTRPPVVTIMGHVDHGKTSLLDAIRKTRVASGESGGITQHIGAYQVEQDGQKISFIDTPGHAAFTSMRARGAQATDIAVLVVAADDSVMPQTIESINHAKAAGVPIIVAINKMDKPEADAAKVRSGLLQYEVFVESMGGEVLDVEVSAKTGENLDKLLEAILLQAELIDLKADPNRTAEGVVIEAQLDKGRGPVATVLVQTGTLRRGDIVVAGDEWGRVRALVDDKGDQHKEAAPSMPIEVLGMNGTPQAGDRFAVVESEAKAREISEYRQRVTREKQVAKSAGQRGSLEQMMSQLQDTGLKTFPLVIKGDVQGSIEAIDNALEKLGTDEVQARIIHSGAGAITESDIALAEASKAAIIGFNVRANKQAREAASRDGIEIRYYNVIYDLVDDVKDAMSGLLSPERRESFLGNAEIREVFNITKVGKVAGCLVTEGEVERGAGVRLIRDNVVIHEGTLKTLKRFKDEVSKVQSGQECGMAFQNYEDIREGDIIECFRVEHVARSL
ncbi:translation initiation factor IF-2 [Fulvimarina sp. 2208YS6-2-32]|uniref:Translation initiation factor IF-2 n=1 Tax=Fulvimarina uroteuthidis TaxID=3098149 RepID=A0ABU5HXG9_9HYPH|nr:translation initiation factor IF-2 [Fulvimarina sp. 2208YS6-2-32]MDY8107837.1 translation initiation factor IF-2 [Fulvimarina sp. 2208YS6-2-32]